MCQIDLESVSDHRAGGSQRLAGRCELRCEPLERRNGAFGLGDEIGRPAFVVVGEGGHRCRTARRQLGHVPQALALAAQLVLPSGSEPLRVGDERREPVEPLARRDGVARQLLVRTPGRLQLTPCPARLAHGVARPRERVERRELVARPPEPALLELAAHREQRLGGGRDVLARGAPAPRIGPRAPVGEDPAGEHEDALVVGPQLRECSQLLVFR